MSAAAAVAVGVVCSRVCCCLICQEQFAQRLGKQSQDCRPSPQTAGRPRLCACCLDRSSRRPGRCFGKRIPISIVARLSPKSTPQSKHLRSLLGLGRLVAPRLGRCRRVCPRRAVPTCGAGPLSCRQDLITAMWHAKTCLKTKAAGLGRAGIRQGRWSSSACRLVGDWPYPLVWSPCRSRCVCENRRPWTWQQPS